MKQEKNKFVWAVFGIGILLQIFMSVLLFGSRREKLEKENEFVNSVVTNGIAFAVPKEYTCYPHETSGLLIYNDKDFSMLLRVTEETFEELQTEHLQDKAEQAGYICRTGIMDGQIRGKKYLYFAVEFNGKIQYAIFTAAGKDHCARVILDTSAKTEQEVLELAASILETASETDREDTTYQDMLLLQTKPGERVYKSEAIISDEQGKRIAAYGIPEGFYQDGETRNYDDVNGYEQNYVWIEESENVLEGNNIYVTIRLEPVAEGTRAEDRLEQKREAWDLSITDLHQTELEGYTIYYCGNSCVTTREEETIITYEFYAVMDYDDGILYELDGWADEHEDAMKLEFYEAFLQIEE